MLCTSCGGLVCSRATGSSAPFRFTLLIRLRQGTSHAIRIEVCRIDWCVGLLSPGFIQTTGINAIKSQLVDQFQYSSLRIRFATRDWPGDSPRAALGPPEFVKMFSV